MDIQLTDTAAIAEWCIAKHAQTNHMYDEYLPYEFHLRMVAKVGDQFAHLLPSHIKAHVLRSLWGHDLIEDARVNYNECAKHLGRKVADLIYAVTNEKGHNRGERACAAYYKGIRDEEGADFVKLCDRIANVQYSKLTQSRMFEMYKAENKHFTEKLGYFDGQGSGMHIYHSMFKYLEDLFNSPLPVK